MPYTMIVFFSWLLVCAPSAPEWSETVADRAALNSEVFWRASLITAGGFTGGGAGPEVWSDGSVFFIKRDTAGSDPAREYQGAIPPPGVAEIQNLLTEAKAVQQRQRGNMTTTLTWQGGPPAFRYDWSWSGFGTQGLPQELAQLEAVLTDPKGMEPGDPPFLKWDGVSRRLGAADLLLAEGQPCSLTLMAGETTLQAKGTVKIVRISELQGKILSLDPSGEIRINKVDGGWISGEISKDGKTGSFRLPVWVTSNP